MEINARKLGRNIKEWRLRRNISQEVLSRQANLKLSNLAKLEGGFNSNPTLSTLIALARILTDSSIDKLIR